MFNIYRVCSLLQFVNFAGLNCEVSLIISSLREHTSIQIGKLYTFISNKTG